MFAISIRKRGDEMDRTYFCIDMKTFFASVECAERGLDPFETSLVVADVNRGKNALCLAVTPKMKAQGVWNRCRLSDIPKTVKYEIAPPRMALYIEYSADIYSVYLDYIDPQDIHVYSIDEAFIDATGYLKLYKKDKYEFAKLLMSEISRRCHIPSTAGIGTNLYLAKIALDIVAKHATDRIGYLDEELYKTLLWRHRPITDFWMVAEGTAKRLEQYGIFDMHGITVMPEDLVYRLFGKDAELLIDHAWGRETCLISDIKSYKSKSRSVSFSQILPRDYTYKEARTVIQEMAMNGAAELMRRGEVTSRVSVFIGYTRDELAPAKGMKKLDVTTNLSSFLVAATLKIYDAAVSTSVKVRKIAVSFDDVLDEECERYNLFVDHGAVEREKTLQRAVININQRFGKNAVLSGLNYTREGTQRERNEFIGGHRAGYDDAKRKS